MIGLDCGFLTLSNAEVKAIFEPVIAAVLLLIKQQIDAVRANGEGVSAILLGTVKSRSATTVC